MFLLESYYLLKSECCDVKIQERRAVDTCSGAYRATSSTRWAWLTKKGGVLCGFEREFALALCASCDPPTNPKFEQMGVKQCVCPWQAGPHSFEDLGVKWKRQLVDQDPFMMAMLDGDPSARPATAKCDGVAARLLSSLIQYIRFTFIILTIFIGPGGTAGPSAAQRPAC